MRAQQGYSRRKPDDWSLHVNVSTTAIIAGPVTAPTTPQTFHPHPTVHPYHHPDLPPPPNSTTLPHPRPSTPTQEYTPRPATSTLP